MRRLLSLTFVLFACSRGESLANRDPASPEIQGLLREGSGTYAAGAIETFRLQHSGDGAVVWNASAGALTASGDEVSWTLPAVQEATLTASVQTETRTSTASFHFRLDQSLTAAATPTGAIDTVASGSSCALQMNPSGNPVVIYRNDAHPSIWYATWTGTAWQTELIDGMGYEIGGSIDEPMSLALAADGTPHVAYTYLNNHQLWYATRSGGVWTREHVDTTVAHTPTAYGTAIAIALDPAHGNRPTIGYSSNQVVAIAARTGANTWTNTQPAISGLYYANTSYFQGGLAFTPAGQLYFTLNSGYYYLATWNGSVAAIFQLPAGGLYEYGPTPIVLDANATPIAMLSSELAHVTPGTSGLTNATATVSPYEAGTVSEGAIAYANGKAHLAYEYQGATLELVQPNAAGYWQYSESGSMQISTFMGAAVDPAGATHACYQLSGKIAYQ